MKYFVSYHFSTQYGAAGFGMTDIMVDPAISSFEDVMLVRDRVLADNKHFKEVIILGWQRYDTTQNNKLPSVIGLKAIINAMLKFLGLSRALRRSNLN